MNHLKVKFETAASKHGQRRIRSPKLSKPGPPQTPHVSRLMALAIRLEHLIETGQIANHAEIARAAGLTRARVTQILNLTNLAPDIQQTVLELADHSSDHLTRRPPNQTVYIPFKHLPNQTVYIPAAAFHFI